MLEIQDQQVKKKGKKIILNNLGNCNRLIIHMICHLIIIMKIKFY